MTINSAAFLVLVLAIRYQSLNYENNISRRANQANYCQNKFFLVYLEFKTREIFT